MEGRKKDVERMRGDRNKIIGLFLTRFPHGRGSEPQKS